MKRIGAITIGQAPRTDILTDIAPILGNDVEFIQVGALDHLSLEDVQALRPNGNGNTLVSRMRDGTAVTLQEQKIFPLIQQCIDELEQQGVLAILLMCTGEFPNIFTSCVPLIYPSKIICKIVSALHNVKSLGVITPDADQISDIVKKWEKVVPEVVPVLWNPYLEDFSSGAVKQLKNSHVDLVVMDCFGYSKIMRDFVAQSIGKPIVLSRTISARLLLEII